MWLYLKRKALRQHLKNGSDKSISLAAEIYKNNASDLIFSSYKHAFEIAKPKQMKDKACKVRAAVLSQMEGFIDPSAA